MFACGTAGYFSSVFTAEVDLGGLRWFAIAGMFWCALIALLMGLVLLQMQSRLHVFGELALVATPLLVARKCVERWPRRSF